MNYNFDITPERRGTGSMKWDAASTDVLPFWVADMDFSVAPAIKQAILRRAEHDVYGYVHVTDDYYNTVIHWFKQWHAWDIDREWMDYTIGVVPALAAIIHALTTKDDKILVQSPVYNHFFIAINNSGREVVCNPLVRTGNTYVIDYDDLERKAADERVKILLLCNPHNPVGRVWKREELVRIGEICLRHGVTVIADEIHCELTMPDYAYTPFASLCKEFLQHSVTCTSATKAFNIAGLKMSNIVCANLDMRQRIGHQLDVCELHGANPFGMAATIAAYEEGADWLDSLRTYLWENYRYMQQTLANHLPQCPVMQLEGTYLVWMDCRALGMTSAELEAKLKTDAGIWLNGGMHYGDDGEGYMRWNIGCSRELLAKGLRRFVDFAKQHLD